MRQVTWGLICGEYPPQLGGVGDYTWRVANALVRDGDEVHVFAPACDRPEEPGAVRIHRIRGGFGVRGLLELRRELEALPEPRRLLLQFVVQSFGMRAMNVFFGAWVRTLRGYPLWVMFHEYAIADSPRMSIARRVQAWITRRIAASVARASDLSFYGTSEWRALIERAAPSVPCRWLPVPSNVGEAAEPSAVAEMRESVLRCDEGSVVVGHFGTYRMAESVEFLSSVILRLSAENRKLVFFMLGHGSVEFADRLRATNRISPDSLVASGRASESDIATFVAACDVLVQPYPDGVTTRRGSVMAGLALGVPIVTTSVAATQSLWHGALALAPFDVEATVAQTLALVEDRNARVSLGARGRELYRRSFAVERLVETLRAIDGTTVLS